MGLKDQQTVVTNDENEPPAQYEAPRPPPIRPGGSARVPLSVRSMYCKNAAPQEQHFKRKCERDAAEDNGVKVIVRVRPLNQREKAEGASKTVYATSSNCLEMCDQPYTFDNVAAESTSQEGVFRMVGLPLVEHCLAGFNSSVFAYGQTGSGKTYTMWGSTAESDGGIHLGGEVGLLPRVFEKLFSRIRQEERSCDKQKVHYQCRCSFLEIYNEQIKDLLEPSEKTLQIREDSKKRVYVDNLTEELVTSMEDMSAILLKGLANRKVGATFMNLESSRSHCIFTCVVERHTKNSLDGTNSTKSSRINLVDLAGSERQRQSGTAGEWLKEAGNINRSLSQLGNVINILADIAKTGKQRHVPYRDSRLTYLLQESIGGNSKLTMICAISPASSCKNETQSTLRFAQRAKTIQNKAVVNEEATTDTNFLRDQIRQLKEELSNIRATNMPSKADWNSKQAEARHSIQHTGKSNISTERSNKPSWTSDEPYTSETDTEDSRGSGRFQNSVVDWMLVVEDLRTQVSSYEKCTEDLRQALGIAMAGNAKLVEQYQELQDDHLLLLAQHRRMQQGAKAVASRLGVVADLSRQTSKSHEAAGVNRLEPALKKKQPCSMCNMAKRATYHFAEE